MSNAKSLKNVVVIETDQQRFDTVAALGSPHMITPNLDRLVREGVSFTSAYCAGATCVASRAAMYTGMYAHNTGCYSFDRWAHNRTWVHELHDAGFRTAAIGKVHHTPPTEMMAFDDRIFSENFPRIDAWYDDYANYLKAEGQESGCRLITADGRWMEKCCADVFPLDEKYHVDQFVGRMSTRWITEYADPDPFFLHIGFVGPHDPFDPPARFLNMYQDREVPLPRRDAGGLEAKPPQYKRHMESALNGDQWDKPPGHGSWGIDLRDKTDDDLARMRRHYYAEITQIDEQIGHILGALESTGRLESTLILFTSDHGENLGDHELMYKWVMTEQTVRVPMICRLPNANREGDRDERLFSQIDIGPTILDLLGIDIPDRLDGVSNASRLLHGDSEGVPDTVYCEDTYLLMAREPERKYIHYAGQPYAEFYDMRSDPWEEHNLIEKPEWAEEVAAMKGRVLDWVLTSRYHGSLPQIGQENGARRIWPQNHPHDPYVLHGGSIGRRDRTL